MLFHVWFATKNRRWLLQGDVLDAVRELMRDIAREKGILLMSCEAIVDHVHLLLEAEDRQELSADMKLLKGISARRVFERFPEMKMDAGTENLWQAGFGAKVVPKEAAGTLAGYIETQWDRLDKYER